MSDLTLRSLSISTLEEKLKLAREAIATIEAEKKYRASLTPAQRLADRLHVLLHTRMDCDYAYSDWSTPLTSCRAQFLQLTQKLLDIDNPDQDNVDTTDIYWMTEQLEKVMFGPNYQR